MGDRGRQQEDVGTEAGGEGFRAQRRGAACRVYGCVGARKLHVVHSGWLGGDGERDEPQSDKRGVLREMEHGEPG